MGGQLCTCTSCDDDIYDYNVNLRIRWKTKFEEMALSRKHINQLYKLFRAIDVNDDGALSIEDDLEQLVELYEYHNAGTKLDIHKKIFHASGEEFSLSMSNNLMTFPEFVICVWTFCSLSMEDLGTLPLYCTIHYSSSVHSLYTSLQVSLYFSCTPTVIAPPTATCRCFQQLVQTP